ncbi:hypothetical protein AcV7_002456 [Taiwanofungus camphoratus]|nr:hypothetical protein AcV7_002456 [Antrodia cinnamomea]
MFADNDPNVEQQILAAYSRLVVENYCIMASAALLFFDFCITFTTEVQRIWSRRFSGATIIFLIVRYAALAERITLVTSVLLRATLDQRYVLVGIRKLTNIHHVMLRSCVPVLRLDDSLTSLGKLVNGAFIVLRIRGIWGSDWRPFLLLAPLCLIPPIVSIYLQVEYIPIAFGPPLYGCGALYIASSETIDNLRIAANAAAIASNTIVLFLTWAKTYWISRESSRLGWNTPLITLLLRDGTLYFMLFLLIEILDIIGYGLGSDFILWDVWTYFDEVFLVIFTSRFMLDLRGVYLTNSDCASVTTQTGRISDVRFVSNVVGNLGAPLYHKRNMTTMSEQMVFAREAEDWAAVEVANNPLLAGLMPENTDIELHTITATAASSFVL